MTYGMKSLLYLFLLVGIVVALPVVANAQNKFDLNPDGYKFEQHTTFCLKTPPSGSNISADAWKDKYTGRFIYCMRIILQDATKAFLNKVIVEFAQPALGSVVVFAMALFGIKLLGGMFRNAKAEGFSFLIKIGFIIGILSASDYIVDFWFDTTDMLVTLVSEAFMILLKDAPFCPMAGGAIGGWFVAFDRFDCLFGQLMGIGGNVVAGRGLPYLIAAAFFTGGIGVWLAFIGFAAFYMVAQFLFRSALLILLSYGGLGLMLLMLPLYLPLILFKPTEDFLFTQWIGFAVGFVIQPALTIAFVLFAITAMDDLMMNGSKYTYINQYDPKKNTTDVKVVPPGAPVPAGYEKATYSWLEPMGMSANDSKAEQEKKLKRMIVPNTPIGPSVKMEIDPRYNAYMKNRGCGAYGAQQTAGTGIPYKAVERPAAFANCTDPKSCREAAKKHFAQAPSTGSKQLMNQMLCNEARTSAGAVAQAGPGGNVFDPAFMFSDTINWNYQAANDAGTVEEGHRPEYKNLGDGRILEMIGSYGTMIILGGTFLTFMKTVPALVNHLTGGPSPKLSFESPHVMGRKLADRMKSGLSGAKKGMAYKNSKGKRGLEDRALGSVGGFLKGFAKGVDA